MKKIYILCDHGLGNRLASLIGGLTIAKRFNFLPIICWPTNNWCYAEFTDLFDLNFDLADNNFSQSIVEQIQELGLHYFFISTFRDNCISTNRIGFDDIAATNEDIIYSQCISEDFDETKLHYEEYNFTDPVFLKFINFDYYALIQYNT